MSGSNTKAQKIDRILQRQIEADRVGGERYYNLEKVFLDIIDKQQKNIEELTATNTLFATTAHRLDAENARLRKYLGSELFKRRQREMQIPTVHYHTYPGTNAPTGLQRTTKETV